MTDQPDEQPTEGTTLGDEFKLDEDFDAHCLHCNAHNDGAMAAFNGEGGPSEGALMLCLYCGFMNVFGPTSFVRGEPDFIDGALHDPDVMRTIFARAMMAAKGEIPVQPALREEEPTDVG